MDEVLLQCPIWPLWKFFVKELARPFWAFAEGTALDSVAVKAAIMACILLLTRPHSRSKHKNHSTSMPEGELEELLAEGCALQ